jgi:hypothetical protein
VLGLSVDNAWDKQRTVNVCKLYQNFQDQQIHDAIEMTQLASSSQNTTGKEETSIHIRTPEGPITEL